jgi:hypothetical protein
MRNSECGARNGKMSGLSGSFALPPESENRRKWLISRICEVKNRKKSDYVASGKVESRIRFRLARAPVDTREGACAPQINASG